ncbi:unnamed protein product [Ectocarpus sp. CCAP 1310/34]|nr:unnamed protein product [Ectocarpus sp. CCAP 1310/34]
MMRRAERARATRERHVKVEGGKKTRGLSPTSTNDSSGPSDVSNNHDGGGSAPLSGDSGDESSGGSEPVSSTSSQDGSNDDGDGSEAVGPSSDDDGGGETSDPGENDGDGNEGGDPETLEELKYDPADSRYPSGTEGKKLLWRASSAGQLRYVLQPGRTRKQIRELRSSEEEPSEAPAPEEALLSTVLETENGPEIVAEYIRESLLEERMQDEQAHRELELAFIANEKDDGSPQPLLDPEPSSPSPIGQKPNDVEAAPLTYKDAMDSKPKRDDEPTVDKPVREALGCLMWVVHSRPDIALPLNKIQKVAHSPTDRIWQALLRVMSYLNATQDLSLTFVWGSGLDLGAWVDASNADDVFDGRLTTGLAVTVGGNTANGTTKTQRVPAQSSSEAEYLAAGEGVKEALHLRAVLPFVAPETSGAKMKVLEDNKGSLALVQNPFSSARSKHIDVRYHFIRSSSRGRSPQSMSRRKSSTPTC